MGNRQSRAPGCAATSRDDQSVAFRHFDDNVCGDQPELSWLYRRIFPGNQIESRRSASLGPGQRQFRIDLLDFDLQRRVAYAPAADYRGLKRASFHALMYPKSSSPGGPGGSVYTGSGELSEGRSIGSTPSISRPISPGSASINSCLAVAITNPLDLRYSSRSASTAFRPRASLIWASSDAIRASARDRAGEATDCEITRNITPQNSKTTAKRAATTAKGVTTTRSRLCYKTPPSPYRFYRPRQRLKEFVGLPSQVDAAHSRGRPRRSRCPIPLVAQPKTSCAPLRKRRFAGRQTKTHMPQARMWFTV